MGVNRWAVGPRWWSSAWKCRGPTP